MSFWKPELLGVVLEDEEIIISQNHGEPVIGKHTVSDTCYQNIARRIAGHAESQYRIIFITKGCSPDSSGGIMPGVSSCARMRVIEARVLQKSG